MLIVCENRSAIFLESADKFSNNSDLFPTIVAGSSWWLSAEPSVRRLRPCLPRTAPLSGNFFFPYLVASALAAEASSAFLFRVSTSVKGFYRAC